MKEITIRNAVIEGVPGLLPLIDQLGYPSTTEDLTKRFKKFTVLDGYGIGVACDFSKIIGWVAWSKSTLLVADKTRIHIEGLVVDTQYRGEGVGKKLMKFVEEYAKKYSPTII